MAKRIDSLKTGSRVTVKFHGSKNLGNESWTDTVTFYGITGEGDYRVARFDNWYAYRYNGRWAYGSSAERLSLVDVEEN